MLFGDGPTVDYIIHIIHHHLEKLTELPGITQEDIQRIFMINLVTSQFY